jgi:hypothetical protein
MDRRVFENNINAFPAENRQAFSRLLNGAGDESQNVLHNAKHYAFMESRGGAVVPALLLPDGNRPLHSLVDPIREAQRIVSTITEETGFVVFLGLGGGFLAEAALEKTDAQVLVIDFCLDGIAELFHAVDYTRLLKNERFTFLAEPSQKEIKTFIIENYRPALCGGIKIIPLRTRTEFDLPVFDKTAAAITEAIENVSADYSVQAHFGKRWFSNIIRNILFCEKTDGISLAESSGANKKFPEKTEAAIAAAGPSLDEQLPSLEKLKERGAFIISCDTALPVLLHSGIEPDAVVSIDCQHISYYHFLGCNLRRGSLGIPLFLDIASPPLLSRLSPSPFFFSGGHPLALYVSRNWRPLPFIDTSGGNVTYACLSLAENLGAQRITLFGADFSYINSRTYARGAYIYPFFEKKQNRFSTLEALLSTFLYRSPFLPPENDDEKFGGLQNYYETSSLRFYRKKLEEKASMMNAQITAEKGYGAPIDLARKITRKYEHSLPSFFSGADAKIRGAKMRGATICGEDFLARYRDCIAALPLAKSGGNYLCLLYPENTQVFFTILPLAASVKRRCPVLKTEDLIEETKRFCVQEIDRLLSAVKTSGEF